MAEQMLCFVCCLLCAFPFFIFSHANKGSREPIVFWTKDKNLKEKIRDIRGYNEEIAKLYQLCALAFVITGLAFFLHVIAGYTAIGLICTLGIYAVKKRYDSICEKYS
ncbi:hypothetical protein GPL15_25105 [Clostridium sp. MCC353]|uniref:hypothetical protein n=1 Tax=Clostridium sp. MCC353 TaxID=2592646 RepID=UPI001C00E177|nr:hypothetical protein [Clostridium sp. MCC353]MBT9779755.1 hypothetical protein [Clostridium sp. MCC353]